MDMIDRACLLVCMVEEIDNIELPRSERIIASIFFAFTSTRVHEVLSENLVNSMILVGHLFERDVD
jgi:hypothetical protein